VGVVKIGRNNLVELVRSCLWSNRWRDKF